MMRVEAIRQRMGRSIAPSKERGGTVLSVVLAAVVLLATWMGYAYGGYFIRDWAPVAFILAALMFLVSVTGALGGARSWWRVVATSLFTLYTAWTFLSLLWSPNRGDAWFGASLTLFYLLAFWVVATLVALGASRRWALIASTIGPALVAAFTVLSLVPGIEALFADNRLIGTVGYFNGEAAFLLVPFWVSIYVAGSRRIHPLFRGLALAGAVLGAEVAVLTQSRGAMVAMAASLPVFFALSGRRLRGLLALTPVAIALFIAFPGLNEVYLEFLEGSSPAAAIERITPTIWLSAFGAGAYASLWGFIDRRWRPSANVVRTAGTVALTICITAIVLGGLAFTERVGNPVVWGQEKWEAFKSNDLSGQDQSRYLSAGGKGRYMLWDVAWEDFVSKPFLGVGTHNYEATYYQERDQAVGNVRQPHTLPLEVLAERGVIGGLLFFGFVGTCLVAGLWRRFGNLNAEGKTQVGALIAALTYWFVHASVEWFWQIPAVTLPAIAYLAMLVAPWSRREEDTQSGWPLRASGAGIAVLAIATVAPLYLADRYSEQSAGGENPWVSLEKIERAQAFNPLDPQLARREAELAIEIGDWPRASQAYAREIRLNPEHYAPYTLLARFYEQRGQPGEALILYRKALQLNPLDPELKQSVSRLQEQVESE